MIGDDGIVATPVDAVKFLKGLMENQLLAEATLDVIKTWVHGQGWESNLRLGIRPRHHLRANRIRPQRRWHWRRVPVVLFPRKKLVPVHGN